MITAKEAAYRIVRSSDYVERWFDAGNFFNTKSVSEVMNGSYFITCDNWMSQEIWALRHITCDGIDTIVSGNNEADCLQMLEDIT